MTCIIGLEEGGKVYIGGDSLGINGESGVTLKTRKVFGRMYDHMIIGVAGSVRMLNLLHHGLEIPTRNGETVQSDLQYMVNSFIPALRQTLKDGGFTYIDNNREWMGNFLVGYNGNLYSVESDFQVNQPSNGMYCIGSGAHFAWGAMVALQELLLTPEQRIIKALEITGQLCVSVGGPYYVEVTQL